MKTLIVSILVVTLAVTCLAFSKKPKSGPIEFETIIRDQHSTMDTSAVYLINNSGQWEKTWQIAYGKVDPVPELQEIDFSKYQALAVFMGQKNSGGFSVEVSEIVLDGHSLNVKVINHVSAGGNMLAVVVNPYHIVKVQTGDFELNVDYVESKE